MLILRLYIVLVALLLLVFALLFVLERYVLFGWRFFNRFVHENKIP